jgi:hypothetical protein
VVSATIRRPVRLVILAMCPGGAETNVAASDIAVKKINDIQLQ